MTDRIQGRMYVGLLNLKGRETGRTVVCIRALSFQPKSTFSRFKRSHVAQEFATGEQSIFTVS
jgi:hypothetical protein